MEGHAPREPEWNTTAGTSLGCIKSPKASYKANLKGPYEPEAGIKPGQPREVCPTGRKEKNPIKGSLA